jgi:hypothetical protein
MRFTRILALGAGALTLAAGLFVGGAVAGADGSSTATYAATVTVPVPPSSNFAGSAGGDGWAVALSTTQVFNVFHHQTTMQVACHEQSDASACWAAPKTITDGSGNNFATSIDPGLYLNQSTGHLYVPGTRTSDDTGGVVCIDTTQPPSAPASALFCGFTALTGVGDAPLDSGGNSGLSDPVIVGNDWYIENEVAGASTGTENQMLCFNLQTAAACGGQPYSLGLTSTSYQPFDYSFPMNLIGSELVFQTNTPRALNCFDPATGALCTGGVWPAAITVNAGAPMPVLNSTGGVIGTCNPGDNKCFDLNGNAVATPSGLAITGSEVYNGPAVVIGARVYEPEADANTVNCYDYVADAECSGFPKLFTGLGLLYTVNPDPQRPTCIWVNADNGAEQIQNFDAFTGGACGTSGTRVLSSSFVPSSPDCVPSQYTSLQILSPLASTYSGGTVSFDDFDGNSLSIPTQPLVANSDGTASANLSSLNITSQSTLPQFIITLPGAGSASIEVKVNWVGPNLPACGAPTGPAPTGVPGHNAIGYRLQGHDGGVFDYGQSLYYGSLPQVQTHGLVGSPIEATANTYDNGGYWLVSASGGVFTYGDAPYLGSLAGKALNGPISSMAGTNDMKGYWLVGTDGGVYTFGDAGYFGSLGDKNHITPIVAIAPTADDGGYWLVDANGFVFPFGDAQLYGSAAGKHLNGAIVGIATTTDGKGYWLVGADGGIFAFGDAQYDGSMGGKKLNQPIVGIVATPDGGGYWLIASDGGVFAFGDAPFLGSAVTIKLNQSITSAST